MLENRCKIVESMNDIVLKDTFRSKIPRTQGLSVFCEMQWKRLCLNPILCLYRSLCSTITRPFGLLHAPS